MSLLILFPGANAAAVDSPYFTGSYFDPAYFDTDGASETPGEGGSSYRRRMSMQLHPPAAVEITDDGWIHILI